MRWLEFAKEIALTDRPGICPYCRGHNTDYAFVLVNENNKVGYLDMWCNDCKKVGHISRVIIDNRVKKVINIDEVEEKIPKYEVTY